KGLLASWIHRNGPRRQDPFVDLNCAGLSRDFLESELFGHERGAFTGAVASKKGLIEIGHRGCVFLDEIGDLPLDVQPKLLKVVEDKKLRRLGEVTEREVDIRLIAASHKDLRELMARGLFREDLYYRLSTLPLRVPPLRQRGQDVLLLARALLVRLSADFGRPEARLSPGGERRLLAHSWPGNIRELRNVLERALLVEHANVIEVEDLAPSVAAPLVSAPPNARADDAIETLAELEARHIDFVVARASGNVTEAARLLGLSRSALYERIRKHGRRGESASRIARRTSRSIGALD
ncbi:MAG: sigma-54-dependent Fis family transcriptional regulator, partial [Acidobacteria bacterium]|nr:sigma-54-dependent Fis family transcriptional regulator [Acidobacteriota bacterium]